MIFTRIFAAALAICAHLINEYSKSEKAFAVSLVLVSLSVVAIIASELGEYIAKTIKVTR